MYTAVDECWSQLRTGILLYLVTAVVSEQRERERGSDTCHHTAVHETFKFTFTPGTIIVVRRACTLVYTEDQSEVLLLLLSVLLLLLQSVLLYISGTILLCMLTAVV